MVCCRFPAVTQIVTHRHLLGYLGSRLKVLVSFIRGCGSIAIAMYIPYSLDVYVLATEL